MISILLILLYSVIDIETTGGRADAHKITEIAIYVTDGKEIIKEYQTLLNPERSISNMIQRLTGITPEMVEDAPLFCEVAKKIVEMTKDTVFIAHNVGFDYGFLRQEFAELGFNYVRPRLCTVRLSRKFFPGYPSYSLGNLCQSMGIPIENRHRAGGDALATTILFHKIMAADEEGELPTMLKKFSRKTVLPPNLKAEKFERLPDSCGVYYFLNEKGKVIYVGKSNNIRKRAISHFSSLSKRRNGLFEAIHDIHFEITGSELVALLLESSEIKKYYPQYNRAQKRDRPKFAIVRYVNQKGRVQLGVDRWKNHPDYILPFTSIAAAKSFLHRIVKKYNLCPRLCGLQSTVVKCFDHLFGECEGNCDSENVDAYNEKVERALAEVKGEVGTLVILDKGRNREESAMVLMEQGSYAGYGFVPRNISVSHVEDLQPFIQPKKDTKETQRIIRSFLNRGKHKVLRF